MGNMAIEIDDLPIETGGFSIVLLCLPEGRLLKLSPDEGCWHPRCIGEPTQKQCRACCKVPAQDQMADRLQKLSDVI